MTPPGRLWQPADAPKPRAPRVVSASYVILSLVCLFVTIVWIFVALVAHLLDDPETARMTTFISAPVAGLLLYLRWLTSTPRTEDNGQAVSY